MARKMKDSKIAWIGEIPEEWICCKQKFVIQLLNGRAYKDSEFEKDGKYKVLRVGNLFTNPVWYTSSLELEEERYCEHGDLLYAWSMSYAPIIWHGEKVIYHYHIWKVILSSKITVKFAFYYLMALTNALKAEIHETTMGFITMGIMNNSYIAYPTCNEQCRIATFLDKKCAHIDAVIEKTRTSIDEYKKLKQAIITRAVTKGIRKGRKMKNSGIDWMGEIPEEWQIKRLRYIGRCQNGISKGGEFFGSGFPFVSYSDVYKNMELPQVVNGLVESTEKERELYSVERGDIFFTRTSETIEEIGFTSVCKETIDNATFAGFLIRVRPFDENLDVGFSKYYFHSDIHRQFFVKEMNLVIRASLGQELLKKLPVLIPPLPEQQEIASYLDEKTAVVDRLITKKEQLVAEMESCKKSLIYEYVTGKKEVPA